MLLTGSIAQAGETQAEINDRNFCTMAPTLCNPDIPDPTTPAPPPKPDVWGAIAVSSSTLYAGSSWNYSSEADAAKRATAECRASGASDCRVVVTVADVCVALATSKAEKVYAVGGPIGAANYADGGAVLKCQRAGGRNCTVDVSICADGIRHVTGQKNAVPAGRRR